MEKQLKKTKKPKNADQISKEIAKLSKSCEATVQKIEDFLKIKEPKNDQT